MVADAAEERRRFQVAQFARLAEENNKERQRVIEQKEREIAAQKVEQERLIKLAEVARAVAMKADEVAAKARQEFVETRRGPIAEPDVKRALERKALSEEKDKIKRAAEEEIVRQLAMAAAVAKKIFEDETAVKLLHTK